MSETSRQQAISQGNRPVLLTLFCILSFIFNVVMLLIGIGGIFSTSYISDIIESYAPGGGSLGNQVLLVISFGTMLIFGLKLWGVIMMFFGKKGGYVLYLIPTGILMIINVVTIFATFNFFLTGLLLISILFVVVYSIYLKFMD